MYNDPNASQDAVNQQIQKLIGAISGLKPVLSGLEVSDPVKTEYAVGERLDTTGMTVTAQYSDGKMCIRDSPCTWPLGERPRFPFIYFGEVWTGIEYEVAALLIREDLLDCLLYTSTYPGRVLLKNACENFLESPSSISFFWRCV